MRVQDHTGREFNSQAEMCKHYRIPYLIYKKRLDAGMSIEEALTTPHKEKNKESVAGAKTEYSCGFRIEGKYPSENFLRYCELRKEELARELYDSLGGIKGYKPDMHAVELTAGEFSAYGNYKKQIQDQAFWYSAADIYFAGEELVQCLDQNTLFAVKRIAEGTADNFSRIIYQDFTRKYGLMRSSPSDQSS